MPPPFARALLWPARRIIVAIAVLAGGGLFAADPAPAPDRAALAKQATEQRLAYATSADYNPYETGSRELLHSANEHLDKKEFTQAIVDARKGLEQARYNIDLLIVLSAAYRAAGDIKQADETCSRWMSLVDSILASGDGKSFDTAFKVIDVREEYALIHVLRLQPVEQFLQANGSSEYDVMRVKSPKSDETFDLYFNIDLPKGWLNRQFGATK